MIFLRGHAVELVLEPSEPEARVDPQDAGQVRRERTEPGFGVLLRRIQDFGDNVLRSSQRGPVCGCDTETFHGN